MSATALLVGAATNGGTVVDSGTLPHEYSRCFHEMGPTRTSRSRAKWAVDAGRIAKSCATGAAPADTDQVVATPGLKHGRNNHAFALPVTPLADLQKESKACCFDVVFSPGSNLIDVATWAAQMVDVA